MNEYEDAASRKRRLSYERQKRWRAKQSQESRAKIRVLNAVSNQERINQMTPEQLAAHRIAHAASQRRYIDRLTPQKLETLHTNNAASQRKRIERMTPEQLAAHRIAHAASQRRYMDRLTPQQLEDERPTDDSNYEFDPCIAEEEKRFYLKAYPTIDIVRDRKTHCTVCKTHIGTAPIQENFIKMHPILRVTHCNKCHDFYSSGEFSKGEDGSELYCRWCGQGGEMYCCSSCPYVFCKSCIIKNLSRGVVDDIERNENWNCFSCAPKILWPLRAQHWALMNYIDQQKKEIDSMNLNENDLKQHLSRDHSKCCPKAKYVNLSDSMESLDSISSKRSDSSITSSAQKLPLKHADSPHQIFTAKRAKTNDKVLCTPDMLNMLQPDCQITVSNNGAPVYHTIHGYRIDLNSAAQQKTLRLPNGKLIQVKRQGPPTPQNAANISPTPKNAQPMNSPQQQRIIPQTIASRPVKDTQQTYNITVQQQKSQQKGGGQQVVRQNSNMTTINAVNHNDTSLQGQLTSTPLQQPQHQQPIGPSLRPVMIRHVFPDTPIGQARTGLQEQVFNAMEICTHLTNKVQTLTNSNAYKHARNYLEVKELYIHLSYLLTYSIGRFKGLQDKCLGDMRTLGFKNDADSLENGQLAADKQASDDEDNEIEIVEPKTDLITLDSDDDEPTHSTPLEKQTTPLATNTPFHIHAAITPVSATATQQRPSSKPLSEDNMDLMSLAQSLLASVLEVEMHEGSDNSLGLNSTGLKKQMRKNLTSKPSCTLLKQKAIMEPERLEEMKRNDRKLKMKCAVALKKVENEFPYAKKMLEAKAREIETKKKNRVEKESQSRLVIDDGKKLFEVEVSLEDDVMNSTTEEQNTNTKAKANTAQELEVDSKFEKVIKKSEQPINDDDNIISSNVMISQKRKDETVNELNKVIDAIMKADETPDENKNTGKSIEVAETTKNDSKINNEIKANIYKEVAKTISKKTVNKINKISLVEEPSEESEISKEIVENEKNEEMEKENITKHSSVDEIEKNTKEVEKTDKIKKKHQSNAIDDLIIKGIEMKTNYPHKTSTDAAISRDVDNEKESLQNRNVSRGFDKQISPKDEAELDVDKEIEKILQKRQDDIEELVNKTKTDLTDTEKVNLVKEMTNKTPIATIDDRTNQPSREQTLETSKIDDDSSNNTSSNGKVSVL